MNMIMNTERSDKQEIYWWSILDLHLKKKIICLIILISNVVNLLLHKMIKT